MRNKSEVMAEIGWVQDVVAVIIRDNVNGNDKKVDIILAVEGVHKVADASSSSKDDFKLDVGTVVDKVLVKRRCCCGCRKVVECWKVVWGKKARTRAMFDLEVVALRIDLGSGRGTVPDGIGFVVVLGALHGWPHVLDRVMVLGVVEALVVSMVPQMAMQSERRVVPLKGPEAGAIIVEVIESWAAPAVDSGAMCDASFLSPKVMPQSGHENCNCKGSGGGRHKSSNLSTPSASSILKHCLKCRLVVVVMCCLLDSSLKARLTRERHLDRHLRIKSKRS